MQRKLLGKGEKHLLTIRPVSTIQRFNFRRAGATSGRAWYDVKLLVKDGDIHYVPMRGQKLTRGISNLIFPEDEERQFQLYSENQSSEELMEQLMERAQFVTASPTNEEGIVHLADIVNFRRIMAGIDTFELTLQSMAKRQTRWMLRDIQFYMDHFVLRYTLKKNALAMEATTQNLYVEVPYFEDGIIASSWVEQKLQECEVERSEAPPAPVNGIYVYPPDKHKAIGEPELTYLNGIDFWKLGRGKVSTVCIGMHDCGQEDYTTLLLIKKAEDGKVDLTVRCFLDEYWTDECVRKPYPKATLTKQIEDFWGDRWLSRDGILQLT